MLILFACKVVRGTAETASTERLQEDSIVANLMIGGADTYSIVTEREWLLLWKILACCLGST